MQTFSQSVTEAATSVVLGLLVGFVNHSLVFPLASVEVSHAQNAQIAAMCSLVSFIERLLVRRYFNSKEK